MRSSADGKIVIGIDSINMIEITQYIGQDGRHKEKFKDIINIILGGLSNRYLYRREKIDKHVNNVSAMRFFVGQENDRIYCQETSEGENRKIIILGILHLHKDTDELSAEQIKQITTLSNYQYVFENEKGK